MANVARLAGVSSQTVSRVANGYQGVTEATRQQVLTAMKQLGYRPDGAARALELGEFRTIGVILFTLSTTGNVRTLEGITTSAAQEGYAVTLLPLATPTQNGVRGAFSRLGAFSRPGELAVDAVIVIMEVHVLDAVTVSLPPNVPLVVADSNAGDRYSVRGQRPGGWRRAAVRHPLGLGQPAVWHLAGPEVSFAGRHRADAWSSALAEAGVAPPPPGHPEHGDRPAESGRRAGLRPARSLTAPRCARPRTRWRRGCCGRRAGRCRTRCRSVPYGVSAVGFDDLSEGLLRAAPDHGTPGLRRGDRRGVAGVLRRIRQEPTADSGITLAPTQLVVRENTAPPPGR